MEAEIDRPYLKNIIGDKRKHYAMLVNLILAALKLSKTSSTILMELKINDFVQKLSHIDKVPSLSCQQQTYFI